MRSAEDPALQACLPSIFDSREKFSKAQALEVFGACQDVLDAQRANVSDEELFYIYVEQAKLAFYGQNYDQMAAMIDAAKQAVPPISGSQGVREHAVLEVLQILQMKIRGEDDAAYQAARYFSDEHPDMYQAHRLYMNMAYLVDDFESALIASRRSLRLRPSASEFLSMSMLHASNERLEEANAALVAALEIADKNHLRTTAFLEYVRLQVRLGNFDQALMVLDMTEEDKTGDQRQFLLNKAFADNPVITSHRVYPLRRFDNVKEAAKLRAIIELKKGDRKAAVALVEDMYLLCRDRLCLELELAVAEEKDRADEADRLRQKIDRTVFSVSRRFGEWEKNLLAQLASPPRERYAGAGKSLKPDFETKQKKNGVYRIELEEKNPQSRNRLEAALLSYAKKAMAKKGYAAFNLLDLTERYRFRNKGGDKMFIAHDWVLELVPVKSREAVPEGQRWRLISTSEPVAG
ncbi:MULTISPECIES: hypothetical protein [Kordiimonas]|uniref:hypothetical protein n=1 Tax=Kordiimonas TaxID=288021 RepID=UPI00257DC49A|nr:hypothetical protein [Kordiimonas sp. UBA4487]